MAILATQVIGTAGLVANYPTAAAGGDKCATGDGMFLHVKNAHTGAQDVVLVTPQTVDGVLTVQDRTVNVAAGAQAFIAVPDLYRNRADGLASITYPVAPTALTLAALRV